jgi:hemoglobin/transferrin/lactoferrin receptor protein
MKLFAGIATTLIAVSSLVAQDKSPVQEETFRIIASPYEGEESDVPSRVFRIKSKETRLKLQSQTFSDALHETPGVYVQKTAPDRGAPIIRGFSSSRNILIADGVRVNNPVLREGPNEYWNLLDPFAYSNIEVILGPGSVIYGSDAIGGVVLASTKALPRGEKGEGLQWLGGDALFRYGSGQQSFQEHFQMKLAYDDDMAFSFGLTKSEFGDLEMGDSTTLPYSDFESWGGFMRMEYDLTINSTFLLGYDHYDIDDTNRVHKTVHSKSYQGTQVVTPADKPNEGRRNHDFDRRSLFGRYMFRDGVGLIKEADFGISYQYMTEEYKRTGIDNSTNSHKDWRDETWAMNLKLVSDSNLGEFTYGFDYYFDQVRSEDIHGSGVQGVIADDAKYHQLGLYIQDKYGLTEDLDIIGGFRYSWVRMDANKVKTVGAIDEDWNAVTSSFHLVNRFTEDINGFIGISQGFRAPNLSDSTRDDEFGSSGTEEPTADLDPEYFTTLEAGLNVTKENYNLQLSVFHTDIKDMIVRQKNSSNKRNLDGWSNGIELAGEYWISEQWSVFGNLSYIDTHLRNHIDRDANNGYQDDHLSKVPPLNGIAGLKWKPNKKFYAEFFTRYAQDQDQLSQEDIADKQRIPEDGTPGYATYNIRFGYQFSDRLNLGIDLENLSDKYYRVHGSGQNAVGRSVMATLHYKF